MDQFQVGAPLPVEIFRVDSYGNRIRRWMWTHESPQDEVMHEAPKYLFGDTSSNFVESTGYYLVLDRIRALFTDGVPLQIESDMTDLAETLADASKLLSDLVLMVDAHFDPGVKTDDDSHAGASSHQP